MLTSRIAAVLALVFELSACGDRDRSVTTLRDPQAEPTAAVEGALARTSPRQRANSWIGAPLTNLVREWGMPENESPALDGGHVAEWDIGENTTVMVPRARADQIYATLAAERAQSPPQTTAQPSREPFTPIMGDGWGGVILNDPSNDPPPSIPPNLFISGDPYTEGQRTAAQIRLMQALAQPVPIRVHRACYVIFKADRAGIISSVRMSGIGCDDR